MPLVLLLATVWAPAAAPDWNAPTCTEKVVRAGPSQGGGPPLFLIKTYSDWKWVDPAGVTHAFPGTSAAKYFNGGAYGIGSKGPNPSVSNLEAVQASDGALVYLSTTNAGTGRVALTSSLYPKYKVLSIIYAPPGNGSTVNYSVGSGWGTVSTISHSFSNNVDLVASVGSQATPWSGSIGLGWSQTTVDEKSIAITSMQTVNDHWTNTTEGINHDQDIIEIWLNPKADLTFSSPAQATWSLTNNPGDPATAQVGADVIYLTVAQLMGRAPISNPYMVAQLQRNWPGGGALTGPGTDTDFFNIAKQDPYFALGGDYAANTFTPDPARFTLANCPKINYGPASGSVVQTSGYTAQSQTEDNTKKAFTESYSVTASVGNNLTGLISLGVADKMTWTNSYLHGDSKTSATSADLLIVQPPPTWQGPTGVVVYTDNLYGTFLFTYCQMNGWPSS